MGAVQVMHFDGQSGIGGPEADENQRRWDRDQYRKENEKPRCHYDWSRRHLNFEVSADRQIRPIGTSESVNVRFNRRMEELGEKPYVNDKKSKKDKNRLIRFVFSGSTDHMRQMAFGNQEVDYSWSEDAHNEHILRKEDIERWALDIYDWVAKKYGAKNIVGFDVHLDENSPHIHCSVVPVVERLNQKTGELKEVVSWKAHFGKGFTDGKVIRTQLHTQLFEEVNKHYGMERGVFDSGAKHMNKVEYFRLLQERIPQLEKEIAEYESLMANEQKILDDIRAQIKAGKGDLSRLKLQNDMSEMKMMELSNRLAYSRNRLKEMQETEEELRGKIERGEKRVASLIDRIHELSHEALDKIMPRVMQWLLYTLSIQFRTIMEQKPWLAEHFDNSGFEDFKTLEQTDNLITDLLHVVLTGIGGKSVEGATIGGGGGNNDLPKKKDDEDLDQFIRRCVFYTFATRRKAKNNRTRGFGRH